MVFEASRERGLTVLLVTHSMALAGRTQNQLRLVDGEVHRL
jgi:predicted ABC-type transport system involved in lysophospholipase L1 biosynthesis ATPase subunit